MIDFYNRTPFILLEDSRANPFAGNSYLFTQPEHIETAADGDVRAALARLHAAAHAGKWIAGHLSYEAGFSLEPKLATHITHSAPLMWFGIFTARQVYTAAEMDAFWSAPQTSPLLMDDISITPAPLTSDDYTKAVASILDYIQAGDIYQANLTFQANVTTSASALNLYRTLRMAQRVPYAALIHDGAGGWALSFSPELFFETQGNKITARPMKGTIRRSLCPELDKQFANSLQNDPKNRAENLMIVDLLRNDLSRVCKAGTIEVPELYTIETLPTVHAMTSTITGTLNSDTGVNDILAAIFPCGSITGAPKIRAMEIIAELEACPRGLYCGSIGYFSKNTACFNVAIRTLVKIAEQENWHLGLGSGIVADSNASDEWSECLLKAQFLKTNIPNFDLFETMAWQPDKGFVDFDRHIARLQQSATYWGFSFEETECKKKAQSFARHLNSPSRVRLMMSPNGLIIFQAQPLTPAPTIPARIVLAPIHLNSDMPFLYHKTTHRTFYDDIRKKLADETGCYECIFRNEKNEMTEGSFTSLFVRKNGILRTPALSCGLLPGILRQQMLDNGTAIEAVLSLADLQNADALYIGNSLRGLIEAKLELNSKYTP
jgi:para-aminobenzoate synthetase / 4-amino-4-deoxychorismate lyase